MYPHTPGFQQPGTSRVAAARYVGKALTIQEWAYRYLRQIGPATPQEIADWMNKQGWGHDKSEQQRLDLRRSVSSRLTELGQQGLALKCASTRTNRTTYDAHVWRATTAAEIEVYAAELGDAEEQWADRVHAILDAAD